MLLIHVHVGIGIKIDIDSCFAAQAPNIYSSAKFHHVYHITPALLTQQSSRRAMGARELLVEGQDQGQGQKGRDQREDDLIIIGGGH